MAAELDVEGGAAEYTRELQRLQKAKQVANHTLLWLFAT